MRPSRAIVHAILAVGCVLTTLSCGKPAEDAPPIATPSFRPNRARAALGSPLEVEYKFEVAQNAPPFQEDHRVFVHFLDDNETMMWTDDHWPQIPTRQWKPGQKVSYQRTTFIPIYPYVGEASIVMGLYSLKTGQRLPLKGENMGLRAYKVGTLQVLPQTENIFVIFKDGWHPSEVSEADAAVEWQWSKKNATVTFRNPRRDLLLYLHAESSKHVLPQQVQLTTGHGFFHAFQVDSPEAFIKKIEIPAAQLGPNDMADVRLSVDKAFVPARLAGSVNRDERELGLRVFHFYVQPR